MMEPINYWTVCKKPFCLANNLKPLQYSNSLQLKIFKLSEDKALNQLSCVMKGIIDTTK